MNLLGIDVGTSGSRALILDASGKIVAAATEEHAPVASQQAGYAQQDPQDWWRATKIAVRKALTNAGISGDQIACVGFSGQMHGAVLLDKKGSIVRNAILWCDVRTTKECSDIHSAVGRDRLLLLTCNPALENFTLPKLLWVRKHEPENWKQVRSVLLPKDYVRLRLTGERATDMADASGTLMLDVSKREWSEEVLQAMKLIRHPAVLRVSPDLWTCLAHWRKATGLKRARQS
jgi:xylulokinase